MTVPYLSISKITQNINFPWDSYTISSIPDPNGRYDFSNYRGGFPVWKKFISERFEFELRGQRKKTRLVLTGLEMFEPREFHWILFLNDNGEVPLPSQVAYIDAYYPWKRVRWIAFPRFNENSSPVLQVDRVSPYNVVSLYVTSSFYSLSTKYLTVTGSANVNGRYVEDEEPSFGLPSWTRKADAYTQYKVFGIFEETGITWRIVQTNLALTTVLDSIEIRNTYQLSEIGQTQSAFPWNNVTWINASGNNVQIRISAGISPVLPDAGQSRQWMILSLISIATLVFLLLQLLRPHR